ncbi:MAG TPA: crossover junction endodeoxyribonuclease RuvC [Candidatus Aminicenantes bacterium]|nr:crossover junction endodeoxyribonuclease RuvC [Candidatus Aminicenantes bacterium]
MIVAGFDPGSRRFGVALLLERQGTIRMLHCETISLKQMDFLERMQAMWHNLNEILERFRPDEAALEEGFLGANARSQNVLAQVRGVVMAAMIHHQVPLSLYSPRTVKQAVTGSGNAGKDQVQRMMGRLLCLESGAFKEDESDAMAVAYCHLLSRPRGVMKSARTTEKRRRK